MIRDLLPHLPIVVSVAKRGGFAAAASALNMSPSAVSHAVRVVEDRLGEPIFARTTRSVALTEAGERFLASIGPALDDIGKAVEGVTAQRGEVTGLLRINAPRVAVLMVMAAILQKLAWSHPRLTVEVHTNDAFVNIIEQGFDAGIRLGDSIQQDMVSIRLTPPFKAIMVAAPSYLAARGMPQSIEELSIAVGTRTSLSRRYVLPTSISIIRPTLTLSSTTSSCLSNRSFPNYWRRTM